MRHIRSRCAKVILRRATRIYGHGEAVTFPHAVEEFVHSLEFHEHNDCDGRPMSLLLQELEAGVHDPMTADFLILEAVCVRRGQQKVYKSNDNRRLMCLKQWQDRLPT